MPLHEKEVVISGGLARIARLKDEYFDWITEPESFVANLKASEVKADLFTFMQEVTDQCPRYKFHVESNSIAVVPITTFDHWWSKQINSKTRNMIRRAEKAGVRTALVDFSDELVNGIAEIYNESPLRQGKPFKHYKKDFETLKRDHFTYHDLSQFIGAFYKDKLIGFAKLFHGRAMSSLMQVISKISERQKSPTNALIAKAVEICADRSVSRLHYGIWSARGLGEFKKHHAFEPLVLPRYFVPLNLRGSLALRLQLHRNVSARLPQKYLDLLQTVRAKAHALRYGLRTA